MGFGHFLLPFKKRKMLASSPVQEDVRQPADKIGIPRAEFVCCRRGAGECLTGVAVKKMKLSRSLDSDRLKDEEADQKSQDCIPCLHVNKIGDDRTAAEVEIGSKIVIAKNATAHYLPPKVQEAKKLQNPLLKIPSAEHRPEFPKHCSRNYNAMLISKLAQKLNIKSCSSIDDFNILGQIGEGAYGAVFRAVDKRSNEVVALKQFRDCGKSTEREISHLSECQPHPSIIKLKDVVLTHNSVCLVLEHADTDLYDYIKRLPAGRFSELDAKPLMLQLLWGAAFLHERCLLHRDLKTSNVLVTRSQRGIRAKLCDFGLCRRWIECDSSPASVLSPPDRVGTLWYRAPELLLGAANYTSSIDMWSLGCIMAEMLLGEPIFPGRNEIQQVLEIFAVLGTPTERSWPGFRTLPGAELFEDNAEVKLCSKLADIFVANMGLSCAALDLLLRLLCYDPSRRITAQSAMEHPWFRGVPKPASTQISCAE